MDRAGPVIVALLLCAPAAASAHREMYPKQDRLELSPGGVRLLLGYAVPAGDEARALRRLFDRDRDGTLGAEERAALNEHLARLALHFLSVKLDGRPLPLRRAAVEGGPEDAERLAVTVTVEAALPPGAHVLRLSDRHKDRRLAVPVTVSARGVRVTSRLPPQPFVGAAQDLELAFAL